MEQLWALWTTKEGFESWWGPQGFRVDVHRLEARLGGVLEYDMIADSPEMVAAMRAAGQAVLHNTLGHYSRFEPLQRLAIVHLIDFIPGHDPYETLIEVAFEADGGGSRMIVTLHPHQDAEWTRMAGEGFESQLTKLDQRFA